MVDDNVDGRDVDVVEATGLRDRRADVRTIDMGDEAGCAMYTSALDEAASVNGFFGCDDRARTREAEEEGE